MLALFSAHWEEEKLEDFIPQKKSTWWARQEVNGMCRDSGGELRTVTVAHHHPDARPADRHRANGTSGGASRNLVVRHPAQTPVGWCPLEASWRATY